MSCSFKDAGGGAGRGVGATLLSALVVAALLLVGACAGPEATPRPVAPEVPEPSAEIRGLVLPFDEYELSMADIELIEAGKEVLIRECMKRRGHSWSVVGISSRTEDLRNRRRYGVSEPAVARTFGYHVTAELLGRPRITAAQDKRNTELSAPQQRAVFDPDSGCERRAFEWIQNGADADTELFNKLSAQSLTRAQHAPDVSRSMRAWEKCMNGHGFDYRDPYDAGDDKAWAQGSRPSRREIAVATADVECKRRSGLVEVWSAREATIQRADIRANEQYFTTLRLAKQRELRAAREALHDR